VPQYEFFHPIITPWNDGSELNVIKKLLAAGWRSATLRTGSSQCEVVNDVLNFKVFPITIM